LAATAAALAVALAPAIAPPPATAPRDVSVIVREVPGAGDSPERLVRELGGRVERHIRIIRGFIAEVPAGRLDTLRSSNSVYSVTRNARIELQQFSSNYDPGSDLGSLYNLIRQIQAPEMWRRAGPAEESASL
jgi:serine protease AprX